MTDTEVLIAGVFFLIGWIVFGGGSGRKIDQRKPTPGRLPHDGGAGDRERPDESAP